MAFCATRGLLTRIADLIADRGTTRAVTDSPLSKLLPPDLHERLGALAARMGQSPEACLTQAVAEFCEAWQEHYDMLDDPALTEDERDSLRVVNE